MTKNMLILGANGVIGREVMSSVSAHVQDFQSIYVHRGRGREKRGKQHGDQNNFYFSLDSIDSFKDFLEEVDVLIHCAHESFNSLANSMLLEYLLFKCPPRLRAIVYIGTSATYALSDSEINECSPKSDCPTSYIKFKRNSEELLREISESWGISVTVIQPGIVTSQGFSQWEIEVLSDLLTGRVSLPFGGRGMCNSCSAKDIARSTLEVLDNETSGYQERIVVGEVISWRDFYLRCARSSGFFVGNVSVDDDRPSGPEAFQRFHRRFSVRRQLAKFALHRRRHLSSFVVLWVLSRTSRMFRCPSLTGPVRALFSSSGTYASIFNQRE